MKETRVGIVTLGFGTGVAMWALAYLGRLPGLEAPSPLLLALLVLALLAGGALGGLYLGGWRRGAAVGGVAGLINLLILGSLLAGDEPNALRPSLLIWIPGFLLVSAVLGAAGALAGSGRSAPAPAWNPVFARVTVVATALLLAIGGVVTSKEVGLAVVDWPNSYGYNMFLYPLSRMTGGIYYEHAHRLFGALVGLTTLMLAVVLQRGEPRAWVRRLGWLALVLVVVQGLLGGLRVTGRFTMELENVTPNLTLAAVHGVLAQVFFALLVAIAAFTSPRWIAGDPPQPRPGIRAARVVTWFLLAALLVQLVLGAIQRHMQQLLLVHVALAFLVGALAFAAGFRAWGNNPGVRLLQRCGMLLIGLTMVQILLGLAAYVITQDTWVDQANSPLQVLVTTSHQWCGAVLLATAVLVQAWSYRSVRPATSI